MNRIEEFNIISDKWRVLCAVMMSKGYFPTVARDLFFSLKEIKKIAINLLYSKFSLI